MDLLVPFFAEPAHRFKKYVGVLEFWSQIEGAKRAPINPPPAPKAGRGGNLAGRSFEEIAKRFRSGLNRMNRLRFTQCDSSIYVHTAVQQFRFFQAKRGQNFFTRRLAPNCAYTRLRRLLRRVIVVFLCYTRYINSIPVRSMAYP